MGETTAWMNHNNATSAASALIDGALDPKVAHSRGPTILQLVAGFAMNSLKLENSFDPQQAYQIPGQEAGLRIRGDLHLTAASMPSATELFVLKDF